MATVSHSHIHRLQSIRRSTILLHPSILSAQVPFWAPTVLNRTLKTIYRLQLMGFTHHRVACPCQYHLLLLLASAVEAAGQTLFVDLVLRYRKRKSHKRTSHSLMQTWNNSLQTTKMLLALFVLPANQRPNPVKWFLFRQVDFIQGMFRGYPTHSRCSRLGAFTT